MAWETSDRRARLPKDWTKIREKALERDGFRCTWEDWIEGKKVRCKSRAKDVDHRIPGDDHSMGNLRSLCEPHHDAKTARESGAGRSKRRKEIRARFAREPELHPAYAYMQRLKAQQHG